MKLSFSLFLLSTLFSIIAAQNVSSSSTLVNSTTSINSTTPIFGEGSAFIYDPDISASLITIVVSGLIGFGVLLFFLTLCCLNSHDPTDPIVLGGLKQE